MADFPARDELRRVYEVGVLNPPGGVRPRLTRAALETPGADANALREGSAACGDEVAGSLTSAVAGWWIDSAQDERLDKRVLDSVGLLRKDSGVSLGSVQFSLQTALAADLTIPAETIVSAADGTQFLTTLTATLPKATVGPLSVPVRSIRAGSTVQAAMGLITSIVSTIPGAPADLAVTNALATTPGTDAEDDRSLRRAYKNFFRTAVKGTLDALEEGARRYPGVVEASALEYYDLYGRQTKQVLLAIADTYTDQYIAANNVPPTYQARSQVLASQVFASLRGVRAGGIYVGVFVCRVIPQTVQLVLTFTAGADPFTVSVAARSAMVNYINDLPPGAAFRRKAAAQALQSVPGLVITGEEVMFPPGDIVPKVLEKLGTDLRFVTANSSAVDKPLPTLYTSDGYLVGG